MGAKPLSPQLIQLQSRQNLSNMARLIDGLYQRANTPETREAIMSMNNALQGIKGGTGTANASVLDVEDLLYKVLSEYNHNLDDNSIAGMDTATISIISQIVSTRKKMNNCRVDADFKRGLKTYLKAHKGIAKKSELKQMYEKDYKQGMEEADNYVKTAKILGQLVKSYQIQTLVMNREAELENLQSQIQDLAAKYKQAKDQTTRDRMNGEYQTLLNRQKSLNVELAQAQNSAANVAQVKDLLEQLETQTKLGNIDNNDIAEVEALSQNVAKGIKKSQTRRQQISEAAGAATSAMDSMLNKMSTQASRGATLDDVILREQSASLDDIAGSASGSVGETAGVPTLDDILN